MSILDNLIGIKKALSNGVEQTTRQSWNFVGASVVDNPSADRLDIDFTGGGFIAGGDIGGTATNQTVLGLSNVATDLVFNQHGHAKISPAIPAVPGLGVDLSISAGQPNGGNPAGSLALDSGGVSGQRGSVTIGTNGFTDTTIGNSSTDTLTIAATVEALGTVSATEFDATAFSTSAANPAASGILRGANGQTLVAARNAANTGDIPVLAIGSADAVTIAGQRLSFVATAAGSGAGVSSEIYAQQGAPGNVGANLVLGVGNGGVPGTDSPGTFVIDLGTSAGLCGFFELWADGSPFLAFTKAGQNISIAAQSAGSTLSINPGGSLAIAPGQTTIGVGADSTIYSQQGKAGSVGGALTIGGGPGGTSGTNLAGATHIDLGASVSNQSARCSWLVDGASVFDIVQSSAAVVSLAVTGAATNLNLIAPLNEPILLGSGLVMGSPSPTTTYAIFTNAQISFATPVISIGSAAAQSISVSDFSTNSAASFGFTISASRATGTGATAGGALNLSSGTVTSGTGTNGAVNIQVGGMTAISATSTAGAGPSGALKMGFYGGTPVVQATRAGQLTGAFGSTGTAIADVTSAFSQSILNNNFRVLEDAYNRLEKIIHDLSLST